MADPASLNVNVEINGMDQTEALSALVSVPVGATGSFTVSQPAIGGPRYRLTAGRLSIEAVGDLMNNIALNHMEKSDG